MITFTALCLLLISADVTLAQRNRAIFRLPTQRMLNRYGLERAWMSQATLDPTRDQVRHLVADEDVVYIQSRQGLVTAFDALNGKKLWAAQLGRTSSVSFPITSNDEMAVVITGTQMIALEKYTGKLLWKIGIPSAASTQATMDDDHIYVGARDGSVYAFDLRKIRELFEKNLLPQWSNLTLLWRFKSYKTVVTPPISTGRVVNFASQGGSLYSITTNDRKLVFQFELDGPASAPMAFSRGELDKTKKSFKRYLYLPSEDMKLYCVNMDNGRVRWEYMAGLPIRKAPRVIKDNLRDDVYLTPVRGGMHCLNEKTGKLIWRRPDVTEFLAATPTLVYASDQVGNVLLLSRKDGAVIGHLPLRNFQIRLSNGRTDRLFIATKTGLLVCIREQGQSFPIYHQYPDRRPLLPELTPAPMTP
ncbi:MAG: hypothetical protein Tsb009_09130 [Planctomycetaceae bacterium]